MQFSQNRGKFKVGLRDTLAVVSQILKYIQITWGPDYNADSDSDFRGGAQDSASLQAPR